MAPRRIDLNADVGEGFGRWRIGEDEAVLRVVSSANVACGFHAGDPSIMRRTCELAAESGVSIGAHVGYPDLPGFGRRFIDIEPGVLTNGILYQMGALAALAAAAGTRVRYVKPHGALYNTIVTDEGQAAAVVAALRSLTTELPLVAPTGSAVARLAHEAGIPVVAEGFLDRAYRADGTLLPRGEPGAVLHNRADAIARALQIVQQGTVTASDGTVIGMPADTLCTHGDTPGAADLLVAVRHALQESAIDVRAFA